MCNVCCSLGVAVVCTVGCNLDRCCGVDLVLVVWCSIVAAMFFGAAVDNSWNC
jgi:hypothetical protein